MPPSAYDVIRACKAVATALLMVSTAHAGMTHRWSFITDDAPAPNGTVVEDRIRGEIAHVRGHGADFTNGALRLSGNNVRSDASPAQISAYLDLPNGIISSNQHFTLEAWVTVHSLQHWQRFFEFGRTTIVDDPAKQGVGAEPGEILHTATTSAGGMESFDSLFLTLNRGTTANTQRLSARNNRSGEINHDASRSMPLGSPQHLVVAFDEGVGTYAASGGRLRWYHNGVWAGSLSVPFRLSAIKDVNNWIGRAQTGWHRCAHASIHELRLYDHPLSRAEILDSLAAGPDAVFVAPQASHDHVIVHHQQKVLLDVLANDTGPLTPSTVIIDQPPQHGIAVVRKSGEILYSHTDGLPASDTFTYRVAGPGSYSQPATVTVDFSQDLLIPRYGITVPDEPPAVELRLVDAFPGLSFDFPVAAGSPPGDSQRLFVATRTGRLHVITDVTSLEPVSRVVLYFDTRVGGLFRSRVPAEILSTPAEMGFLGFAFHPDYQENGWLFLSYNVRIDNLNYHRISRITLSDPDGLVPVADPASEQVLIEMLKDGTIHNAGDMHFGLDGYLYISCGDEGGQDDRFQNSQRIDRDFYSGILRLDVDKRPGNLDPNPHPNPAYDPQGVQRDAVIRDDGVACYSIPIDNPFVPEADGGDWDGLFSGVEPADPSFVRSEFWAVGLRSPWRMSIDPQTGDLWCGDVGGSRREEVNLIQRGANYGWAFNEGTLDGPLFGAPSGYTHEPPYYQYSHGSGTLQGNSVIGGVVYRGNRIPELHGTYIFGDYVSGNIWSLAKNGDAPPVVTRLLGRTGIAAYAKDPSNGDILLIDYPQNRIHRLMVNNTPDAFPEKLSETGLFADLEDLSPSPGLLPYAVNLPFWSDHALKQRWFSQPTPDAKMEFSEVGSWSFPAGQLWVKHFDLEAVRGDPATARKLETRLLVKTTDAAYGVSYRWNDAETEAFLVEDAGQELELPVEVHGEPMLQRWRIPSRSDCMACHTPQAGFALSFNTRQLNLDHPIHGFLGNQLETLCMAGCLAEGPISAGLLPRHVRADEGTFSLEARARSYLAVNCAYCHQPGGTAAPSEWDGRPHTPLFHTGTVDVPAGQTGALANPNIITPGDPANSTLLLRMFGGAGLGPMPPLGNHLHDQAGIQLITDWIASWPAERTSYEDWKIARLGDANPPYGDDASNYRDFLLGTPPLMSGPSIANDGGILSIEFLLPPGRRAFVESSDDLVDWSRWQVPGNHGMLDQNGRLELSGAVGDPARFFRVLVEEE